MLTRSLASERRAGAFPHPEAQVAAVSTVGYPGLLARLPLLGLVAHVSSLAGTFYVVGGSGSNLGHAVPRFVWCKD
jgi:hypothetical protein